MKKFLIIVAVIIIVALGGGYYFYTQVVPKMAAKAIVKGEYSPIIPNRVRKKIGVVRNTVNHQVEDVIHIAEDQGITMEQLMQAIDEVDKKEVMNTYQEVIKRQTLDPEEVFNIANQNIKIEAFDPLLLKPAFIKYATEPRINQVLQFVKKNHLMENLDMNMVRSVGKQILLEKAKEIKNKVEVVE